MIKEECNATFIVLHHSKIDFLKVVYETAQNDKKDAFNLEITPEMEEDEIVEKVLDILKTLPNAKY